MMCHRIWRQTFYRVKIGKKNINTASMMGLGVANQQGWRKGPWTPEEDKLLSEYVKLHGEGRWSSVSRCAGN